VAQSDDTAWFESNRGYISTQYRGQYVLIKDKSVIGAYPDWASAFQAGTAMFGPGQFIVQQAIPVQRVEHAIAIGRARRLGQQYPQYQQQYQNVADKLRQDGALVQVVIAAPSSYQQQAAGQGRPAGGTPQTVQGMVDTGASISTVSDQVAAAAGLVQTGSVPLGGVGGTSERPIYAASFSLPQYGITLDPIEVGGVTIPMPGVDILVGRDVLRALHLDYRGPAGIFNLLKEEAQAAAQGGSPTAAGAPASGVPGSTYLIAGAGIAAIAAVALFAFDVI
jgi:hypothetical protein